MFDVNQPAYIAFRNIVSERTDRLVAWIGSGLSIPAELPNWRELRGKLADILVRKARTLEDNERDSLNEKARIAIKEEDLWIAFHILREAIGEATYVAEMRSLLAPTGDAPVPPLYSALWQLPLAGILNLNVDRLATRAFQQARGGSTLIEFSGRAAHQYVHVLRSPTPFLANLHGTAEDSSTWIFTHRDLEALFTQKGYRAFIDACITTHTILFVGISADDVAAGGHLDLLRKNSVDFGGHFWVTDRNDVGTDKWAEAAGIRVIRYASAGSDHSELREAFEDLIRYVPQESPAPPVRPTSQNGERVALPSKDELITWPAERIRDVLNAEASRILGSTSPDSDHEYSAFLDTYAEAIHRSWWISASPNDNLFCGYRVLEQVAGRGAFGRVFRAQKDPDPFIAIKLLHEEIMHDPAMLQSFRRGVRSMKILSDRNVDGMVPYRSATEIPACAIMEFVEGPNLGEAVAQGYIDNWHTVLKVSIELAQIVRCGHLLPERVLHRDIRPENIMLQDYYSNPDGWRVVVLDFDLSWHRDAAGISIDNTRSGNGFLAPELAQAVGHAPTRNALVDSFGLGMTLFFLRSGRRPVFSEHQHAGWRDVLTTYIGDVPCNTWRSLPRRFARLIEWSTKQRQSDRWDLSQILGELLRLQDACEALDRVEAAELWAEELAARSNLYGSYKWDRDRLSASMSLVTGAQIEIAADEAQREVKLGISWRDSGTAERKKVGRWIPKACDTAKARLRSGGWNADVVTRDPRYGHVEGNIPAWHLKTKIDGASKGISEAIDAFRFE